MKYINSTNFHGKIISEIQKSNKNIIFSVKQKVSKTLFSEYEVRLSKEAAIRFGETGLKKGDEVLLVDAISYQKDGKNCLRIEKLKQLVNMSERKESLDLGTERFI